ncbi:hypothetical protein NECID01_0422 [Nematocida sp. AWRm77]|nr:hypothetical protein NECID01_0422 [Nematocida sp. AWRm77]
MKGTVLVCAAALICTCGYITMVHRAQTSRLAMQIITDMNTVKAKVLSAFNSQGKGQEHIERALAGSLLSMEERMKKIEKTAEGSREKTEEVAKKAAGEVEQAVKKSAGQEERAPKESAGQESAGQGALHEEAPLSSPLKSFFTPQTAASSMLSAAMMEQIIEQYLKGESLLKNLLEMPQMPQMPQVPQVLQMPQVSQAHMHEKKEGLPLHGVKEASRGQAKKASPSAKMGARSAVLDLDPKKSAKIMLHDLPFLTLPADLSNTHTAETKESRESRETKETKETKESSKKMNTKTSPRHEGANELYQPEEAEEMEAEEMSFSKQRGSKRSSMPKISTDTSLSPSSTKKESSSGSGFSALSKLKHAKDTSKPSPSQIQSKPSILTEEEVAEENK